MSAVPIYHKRLSAYLYKHIRTGDKLAVESEISCDTIMEIERGGTHNPKTETATKLVDAPKAAIETFTR